MQCQKEFTITVSPGICVDWSTLSAFANRPGSPTVIPPGSLGNGHPGATTWTQFATAGVGGVQWQTLFATLTYDGPACNCNLELITNTFSGAAPFGQVIIGNPGVLLNVVTAGLGTTNNPFALPDSLGVPYTVEVECSTQATLSESIALTFTLSTV